MIRAPWGNPRYWNEQTASLETAINRKLELVKIPAANAAYESQFVFDLAKYQLNLLWRRYSAGANIAELPLQIDGAINAWELSNRLSDEICNEHDLTSCRDWVFDLANLNHYNWCFWLLGLAVALEVPDHQWHRLLALIGGEGEDVLLDRVIASRQPGRTVGSKLLHPKPYARLLKAVDAPRERQAILLREFVDNWYPELARKGRDELWWYIYGDPVKHPLEMGSYFGRWCIEAVAAVKAFGIDDSLCLGHEHYPGDLLRPDGPTTHRPREEKQRTNFLGTLIERLVRR